jgi:superfamily II DNA/RNA helicase/cold shock CspA family protein
MLFSATMGPDVKSLVREFTNDAVIHDVVGEEAPSDVEHYFWRVPRDQRPQFAAEIADKYERALFFTRTKHGADRLARQLEDRGVSAVPLHGDRTQAQRDRALRSVKNRQVRVLVATDVAARGIHIDHMPVVVHYDPPAQATDYLHRSGRTGRAGATGTVISLVGEDVIGQVKRLQKALGIKACIETPDIAPAIRLGAVDDAVAAERLDDRGGKGRSERPASRERGPRSFERREPREHSSSDRPERSFNERAPRGERTTRTDRNFADRPVRNERGFGERTARPERSFGEHNARPERASRPERAPRTERSFVERAPRSERDSRGASRPSSSKLHGSEAVVSFFNDSKGFGFASDDKGDDLFIHFSNIVGDGFKSLSQGQKITFEEATGPKGREARNVRVVGAGRERRY